MKTWKLAITAIMVAGPCAGQTPPTQNAVSPSGAVFLVDPVTRLPIPGGGGGGGTVTQGPAGSVPWLTSVLGVYNSTAPTLSNGATAPLQFDVNGNLKIVAATSASDTTALAAIAATGAWQTSLLANTPAPGQKTMSASSPIAIASDQSPVPFSATALPLPTGAATSAAQAAGNASLAAIATNTTGAATVSAQTTGNTSLATIATNTPTVGPKTAAGSSPVVTAPVQSSVVITPGTPVTAGRKALINCTAAGSIRLKLGDGTSTIDVAENVGMTELDGYAVIDVVAGSTTATCTVNVLN